MMLIVMMQVGAMLGGVSQIMHLLVPAIAVQAWVLIFLVLTILLLLGGGYERVERLAMVKVGLFTLLTSLAAVVLIRMPQYFSWRDCLSGFKFELPGAGVSTALAVFGITGVGAAELFAYPYWCVEKGYARFTGRPVDGADWDRRARGWVRVMHVDIIASMFIYTIATVAFYLLGAGVLHGMGLVPTANDMIPVLSNVYTQTLGEWALWPFYAGAVMTLYGTVFASTAANSRIFADMCRLIGLFAPDDYARRRRYRKAFVVFLTALPTLLFLYFASPVKMVVIGGIAQAMMLPVIGAGTIYLRHRRLPATHCASGLGDGRIVDRLLHHYLNYCLLDRVGITQTLAEGTTVNTKPRQPFRAISPLVTLPSRMGPLQCQLLSLPPPTFTDANIPSRKCGVTLQITW